MELRRNLAASVLTAVAAALLVTSHSAEAASRRRPAPTPKCPSSGVDVVTVTRAVDGGAFTLGDGSEVKLSGVLAPGKDGEVATAAEAQAATDALGELLRTGTVTLAKSGEKDCYGRTAAQVFAGNVWVQGELLRRGRVRAAPDSASASCALALLTAEGEARMARAGPWANGAFKVLSAAGHKARSGTFQIVEGRVTGSVFNRGRAYVNFGADYHTDFTVTVPEGNVRAFRQARLDLRSLAGKRLRVRGWMDFYNGPEMEISSPTAVEILDDAVVSSPDEQAGDALRETRRGAERGEP